MEGQIGEIAVGAHADFLIVDVDPLAGLECFAQADNKVVGVVQGWNANARRYICFWPDLRGRILPFTGCVRVNLLESGQGDFAACLG